MPAHAPLQYESEPNNTTGKNTPFLPLYINASRMENHLPAHALLAEEVTDLHRASGDRHVDGEMGVTEAHLVQVPPGHTRDHVVHVRAHGADACELGGTRRDHGRRRRVGESIEHMKALVRVCFANFVCALTMGFRHTTPYTVRGRGGGGEGLGRHRWKYLCLEA